VGLVNDNEYFADQFDALTRAFGEGWTKVYKPEHVLKGRHISVPYRSWHSDSEGGHWEWVYVRYAFGDLYKPAVARAIGGSPPKVEWY
jgi:hypothetical protein